GTDTMAYTASALSFMLEDLGKTVILTGSQIPLSEFRTDALGNFTGALTIAGHYVIPEVTLFFNNRLFRGNRASKIRADGFDAFESLHMVPLVDMNIDVKINWPEIYRPAALAPFKVSKALSSQLTTIKLFPGISTSILES